MENDKNLKKRFQSMDEFNILYTLGVGGYSSVYACENKTSGRKYAIKCAPKFKKGRDRSERTRTEIKVLEMLDHENIIKLKGWFEDQGYIYCFCFRIYIRKRLRKIF